MKARIIGTGLSVPLDMKDRYDIAILGGGPGGYTAAIRAAQLGFETALIEKSALGGTCVNIGCIPTKALIHSASIYERSKRFKSYGIPFEGVSIDWKGINRYKDRCVIKLVKGVELQMQKNKIDVINGFGKLSGVDSIEVDGTLIRADNIIIATGSRAKSLPSLPIDGDKIITSDHALNLQELPKSILIVGAGAIGCEFAYVFAALKVDVTLVEFLDHALPFEDDDVSTELEEAFTRKKIKIHTRCTVQRVELTDSGVKSKIFPRDGTEDFEVISDKVLVAIGRTPVTDNCGLESAGIPVKNGFIINDEFLHTSVGNIRAIGDCTRGYMLAHKASAEGIIAVEKIAGIERLPLDMAMVPRVTYCQPEVASVGMTENSAREKFEDDVRISKIPFGSIGKAVIDGDTDGFVKLIEAGPERKIIGASAIGPHTSDLIATAATAIGLGADSEGFSRITQAHPTLSESWLEAAHGLMGGSMVG